MVGLGVEILVVVTEFCVVVIGAGDQVQGFIQPTWAGGQGIQQIMLDFAVYTVHNP